LSSIICYLNDVYSGILAILRYYLQYSVILYTSEYLFNRHNFVIVLAYNYDNGQL